MCLYLYTCNIYIIPPLKRWSQTYSTLRKTEPNLSTFLKVGLAPPFPKVEKIKLKTNNHIKIDA